MLATLPYILALDTPLVIFNGRLFQARTRDNEESEDFVRLRETRLSLEEISTPKTWEDLQFAHEAATIGAFRQRYIAEELQRTLATQADVQRQLNNNQTLSFLVEKVLPVITQSDVEQKIQAAITGRMAQSSVATLLAEQTTTQARPPERQTAPSQTTTRELNRRTQQAIEALNTAYKAWEAKEPRPTTELRALFTTLERTHYSCVRDASVFNTTLLPGINALFLEGKIYRLITAQDHLAQHADKLSTSLRRALQQFTPQTDFTVIAQFLKEHRNDITDHCRSLVINKLRTTQIHIAGINFIPIYAGKITELEEPYQKLLEKKAKIDALEQEQYQTQQLTTIVQEQQALAQLVNQNTFERNGAGFTKHGNAYYAFLRIPEYALINPTTKTLFAFPPAHIGVHVHVQGTSVEIGHPLVMNEYEHPFLQARGSMQRMCVGSYDFYSREQRFTPEQKVVSRLSLGKQIIMAGYGRGDHPYRRLTQEQFSRNIITREEQQRRRLPILNDLRAAGGAA